MLFLGFQRASLSDFLSFAENRLPRSQMCELIPEMEYIGYIRREIYSEWTDEMRYHNNILYRGYRMRLFPGRSLQHLEFSSLDKYMLQMRGSYLAKMLNEFCRFGERVLDRVGEVHDIPDLIWIVDDLLMIERSNWIQLCRQIMNIMHVIGFRDKDFEQYHFKPWPDREILRNAAARVVRIFGRFATADIQGPSILQLHMRTAASRLLQKPKHRRRKSFPRTSPTPGPAWSRREHLQVLPLPDAGAGSDFSMGALEKPIHALSTPTHSSLDSPPGDCAASSGGDEGTELERKSPAFQVPEYADTSNEDEELFSSAAAAAAVGAEAAAWLAGPPGRPAIAWGTAAAAAAAAVRTSPHPRRGSFAGSQGPLKPSWA